MKRKSKDSEHSHGKDQAKASSQVHGDSEGPTHWGASSIAVTQFISETTDAEIPPLNSGGADTTEHVTTGNA